MNRLKDDAHRELENARWETSHWARVIAEGKALAGGLGVIYVATPETTRRYEVAIAAERVAEAKWLEVSRQGVA